MKIDFNLLEETYFPDSKKLLSQLISYPSVMDESNKNFPYGEENNKVLDFTLQFCKDMGLECYKDVDKNYGYADFGRGDKLFVIFCHLDVVSPGNLSEWTYNPFELNQVGDKLYGRGTFDDKGPTANNIMAVKYLKDHNFEGQYKIRLFFGLDEENENRCVKKYLQDFGQPDLGYVPDACFPYVFGEKSLAWINITGEENLEYQIKSGDTYNIVDGKAEYQGIKKALVKENLNKRGIVNKDTSESLEIYGKQTHAGLPDWGISPVLLLCESLKDIKISGDMVSFINQYLQNNYDLKAIFGPIEDDSGTLTFGLSIVEINNTQQRIALQLDIPATIDYEKDIIDKLSVALKPFNLKVQTHHYNQGFLFDKEHWMLKIMHKAFLDITKDSQTPPCAIGGGTYAKEIDNAIAFGGALNLKNLTLHGVNEWVYEEEFKKQLFIYTQALSEICSHH
ncbi:Sapep family Mn(2+)-dependent dipeptidase [Spiroplasma alleghenense]|uniref:Dipeptidase n=1 Tax=Spiroplasma alleghenense TaxID=216931 RepID=A0A345Z441_9MOLU|nr:Sapep family Mn(2+)-dependent dipeptidase [Spiroplasma alleghenense]AXK51370.1 dipeptidase [Spiroplasma alleghenense]